MKRFFKILLSYLTVMTNVSPLMMKLAMTVSLTSILSQRARRQTNRYASFTLFASVLLAGCASSPVPFQLVDAESKIQKGTLFPDGQRIEVTVDGQLFKGFYIFASGAAISQALPGRHFFPGDTITNYYSNSALAHLSSDNGQQMNCDFLFEFKRAIGQCKTPAGAVFQLHADAASK